MEEKIKIYPLLTCQSCGHRFQLHFDPRERQHTLVHHTYYHWEGMVKNIVQIGYQRLLHVRCPRCGYSHGKSLKQPLERCYQQIISL